MKRKTVDIDEKLEKTIQEMADKRNWSFSYMSYVLLQQAVKEKLRKKKIGEEDHT
jgi:predicted transcriptional regulator